MAGSTDQEILREYLVSLGFKVDGTAQQRFGGTLSTMDKRATMLGRSLVGVAVAAQAMATEFAFRMERLYYSSKLAESAAGNLQAIDFAGKQSGVSDMTKNVQALAGALRANPGLEGLLNSLGVRVTGRDRADVMLDLVGALKSMPFYIAQRYASMFGISPEDLLLMQQGLDAMRETMAARKRMASDVGVDMEKAVIAGKEYAQQWREIGAYAGLFRDALSIEMLPAMQTLAAVTKQVLTDWIRIVRMPREDFIRDMKQGLGLEAPGGGGVKLTPDAASRAAEMDQQDRAAKIGAAPQKTYQQMTDDERVSSGKGVKNMFGKVKPKWEALTEAERRAQGLPGTDAEKPWDWKATDTWNRWWDTAAVHYGAANPATDGGVQLSRESRDRLGEKPWQDENRSPLQKQIDRMQERFGRGKRDKLNPDPAAVEAATAPDPVLIEREQKLAQNPEVSRQVDEATRKGDYTAVQRLMRRIDDPGPGVGAPQQSLSERQRYLREQEKKYGLPDGLMDRIWSIESSRGKNMESPAGAKGHFGFMGPTADQYGLKDPNDFVASANAAARMLQDLYKKYGDMRYALAAYNWGQGRVDKLLGRTMEKHGDWSADQVDNYVLGNVPAETKRYIAEAMAAQQKGTGQGVEITANTEIKVYEASSARDTANETAAAQQRVNADLVRNFKGRLQ